MSLREQVNSRGHRLPHEADDRASAQQSNPLPTSVTGAGIPYICAARTGPKVFHKIDCPEVRGIIHGLIPGQLGHTLDVAVKEEGPRVLGGGLSDLVGKTRVVPNEGEASVPVLLLPGAVQHPRLDLIVLRPGLAPARMERLVEILHKWVAWPTTKSTSQGSRPRLSIS